MTYAMDVAETFLVFENMQNYQKHRNL